MYLRWFQTAVSTCFWGMFLKILKIYNNFSPLVLIIGKVFDDISNFIVIMLVILFAFSNAFYLMGKNQVQFDNIDTEVEGDYPVYYTILGSVQYIYLMCLGEIQADAYYFNMGDGSQAVALWILFILATFLIIVTMMNMLIAIMSDTFVDNSEVGEQNILKEHLRFVLDQWEEMEKTNINYLIAAFLIEEDDEDVEMLDELKEDVI